MLKSLQQHWPEYLIEAWGLGMFMIAAGVAVTALEFPQSPIQQGLPDPFVRRAITGIAMGLTAISIIYSPWGKRSGAHINPAFTLAFFRIGKIAPWDAFFYTMAQFAGGLVGVLLVTALIRQPFQAPPVNYVVTVPGVWGWGVALVAEFVLSFSLMMMVLVTSNHHRLSSLTGIFAGILVATFITFEAPLSGMSINPARTFASALPAQEWSGFWIYYLAPPLAMLFATEVYLSLSKRDPRKLCGKLCPNMETPCICANCCCEGDM